MGGMGGRNERGLMLQGKQWAWSTVEFCAKTGNPSFLVLFLRLTDD